MKKKYKMEVTLRDHVVVSMEISSDECPHCHAGMLQEVIESHWHCNRCNGVVDEFGEDCKTAHPLIKRSEEGVSQ